MRRIAAFLTLLLISCSGSDADPVQQEMMNTNGTKLVRRVITEEGLTDTWRYYYNGNKIVKTVCTSTGDSNSNGLTFTIEYTGDLISKIARIKNGGVSVVYTFLYNTGGQLIEQDEADWSFQNRTVFSYAANGEVNTQFYADYGSGEMLTPVTQTFVFENGDVSQIRTVNSPEYNTGTITQNYAYDDHHSPFANITGLSRIIFHMRLEDTAYGWATNLENVLNAQKWYDTTGADEYSFEYTYNSYGYPVTAKLFYSDGEYSGMKVLYYYE